jgi:hypothetical protein
VVTDHYCNFLYEAQTWRVVKNIKSSHVRSLPAFLLQHGYTIWRIAWTLSLNVTWLSTCNLLTWLSTCNLLDFKFSGSKGADMSRKELDCQEKLICLFSLFFREFMYDWSIEWPWESFAGRVHLVSMHNFLFSWASLFPLQNRGSAKRKHVHGCSLVRAKKMYGYHSSEEIFVKIYLYP